MTERSTARLVSFSDAVFAITITLLILEIKRPSDNTHLLHGLLALWPSYLAYALTFLFIGQVWANHHVMFDHIRAADRGVLLLNTLLLMIVAFLPFATSVLADALHSRHGQRTAVVFYGIAFDVTALTFNGVWQYARLHGLLHKVLDRAVATAVARRFQLALAWLAVGAALGAAYPYAGVAVIVAFNVFYWLPIRGESTRRRKERCMQITRNSLETGRGPAEWFTGSVYLDTIATPVGNSRVSAVSVHFTPGARTAWHTHPNGQTIYVLEGIGRAQRRGGPVEVLRPGDRVFFEPGEEHWHGAAPDRFMTHVALLDVDDDGISATWGQHVTDDEYGDAENE